MRDVFRGQAHFFTHLKFGLPENRWVCLPGDRIHIQREFSLAGEVPSKRPQLSYDITSSQWYRCKAVQGSKTKVGGHFSGVDFGILIWPILAV
jgi:hypothetical protein